MRDVRGYALLAFAMASVGSTVVAGKWMAQVGPFTGNALRLALALPLFVLALRWTGTALPRLCRHDRWLLAAQAAAGSVGYTALLLLGLRHTSAASAGAIVGTLPIVALVLSMLLLGERPTVRAALAVLLAGGGVAWMTADPADGGAMLGNLLVGAAVLCEGLFILLNRRMRTPLPPLALSTLLVALGLAGSAIPAAIELAISPRLPAPALLGAVYYAIVPTFAGFIAWYAGSARVSAAEASLFTAVAPLAAMALSVLWLGEQPGERQLAGAAVIVVAVVWQALPSNSRTVERSRANDVCKLHLLDKLD
ncbi:DMT family transporter [Massilia sp. METH4]|uniref:DMT family transporter n=1 Tax=Massilia sp. METH4 TaxID=3123041 RepID=UPI0030CAD21C